MASIKEDDEEGDDLHLLDFLGELSRQPKHKEVPKVCETNAHDGKSFGDNSDTIKKLNESNIQSRQTQWKLVHSTSKRTLNTLNLSRAGLNQGSCENEKSPTVSPRSAMATLLKENSRKKLIESTMLKQPTTTNPTFQFSPKIPQPKRSEVTYENSQEKLLQSCITPIHSPTSRPTALRIMNSTLSEFPVVPLISRDDTKPRQLVQRSYTSPTAPPLRSNVVSPYKIQNSDSVEAFTENNKRESDEADVSLEYTSTDMSETPPEEDQDNILDKKEKKLQEIENLDPLKALAKKARQTINFTTKLKAMEQLAIRSDQLMNINTEDILMLAYQLAVDSLPPCTAIHLASVIEIIAKNGLFFEFAPDIKNVIISRLWQFLLFKDVEVNKSAERALREISRQQKTFPLFLKAIFSENKGLADITRKVLSEAVILFGMDPKLEASDYSSEIEMEIITFSGKQIPYNTILCNLMDNKLTVYDIMSLSIPQLTEFAPLIFTQLWNESNNGRSATFKALLHQIHINPKLSPLFYWWGWNNNIIKSEGSDSGVQILYMSKELSETHSFFVKISYDWSKQLVPGGNIPQLNLLDPIHLKRINSINVLKIFDSKARPLLLEFCYEDHGRSSIICKKGDDIRKDWYTQTIFHLFNSLWKDIPKAPFIYTYKCIPICEKFGILECVPNVTSALDFECTTLRNLEEKPKEKFLRSLAGSCLASFVLGIRDRHQDNMLVKDGHIFFHIDFGHLWNQGPIIDAPRISIPMRIKANLSTEEWALFEKICEDGFDVLLKYRERIKNVCVTLFAPITQPNPSIIEEFIGGSNSLMLNLPHQTAKHLFKKMLTRSLANHLLRRKVKNLIHGLYRSDTQKKDDEDPKKRNNDTEPSSKRVIFNIPPPPPLSPKEESLILPPVQPPDTRDLFKRGTTVDIPNINISIDSSAANDKVVLQKTISIASLSPGRSVLKREKTLNKKILDE